MATSERTWEQGSPAVSVVLPAFNAERYVTQTIQSGLDQSFADLELIIVNDGSTDRTEHLIRAFHDPRVKYFVQDNQGPSAARNTGLAHCTGTYVAFVDNDDIWYATRL